MALIVTCKDLTNAIDSLHQISKAIENNKITDWEKIGTNHFQYIKQEYRGRACFRPTIKDNQIYFGLINPNNPPYSVTRELYDEYHALFLRVLIHLSWVLYFRVEQTADRLDDIDAKIAE
jgi:hypothetical protein